MKKITKAVIPVAGLGTRFLPITKSLPKEMLPIINKPILEMIVDEAISSGIEEILFITNPYKKVIEDYFDVSYELEDRLYKSGKHEALKEIQNISKKAKIYFIRQGEPLGNGHAINLAKTFVGNEPFAIFFGDDLYKCKVPALKQLIQVYENHDCNVIGVKEVDKNVVNRYGILKYDKDNKIVGIIEKPSIENAPSYFAGLGRYILKPEIFDFIEKKQIDGKEINLTDAMTKLMKHQDFRSCVINGTYYDTGNKLEYLKANIDYALEEDIKEELRDYISNKF